MCVCVCVCVCVEGVALRQTNQPGVMTGFGPYLQPLPLARNTYLKYREYLRPSVIQKGTFHIFYILRCCTQHCILKITGVKVDLSI